MQYDPIKAVLGRFFNRTIFLRTIFYRLLNILLLRSWHVRKELAEFSSHNKNATDINILDAGSGFGQYTWVLARKNPAWKIKGIEIKQEQVDDCNTFFQKAGLKNVVFQFEDLTRYISAETYDLILSVDVMEHIEEDIQVFKNFHASLKPGGVLLISTPSDQGGSDVKHEHDTSFIEEHVRDGYGINEIEEKLRSSGFHNVKANYSYGTPGKISWRLSMKVPILMLEISKVFFVLLPIYYLVVFPFCIVLNYLDLYKKHKSGTGLIVKASKTT
jgi:2-polyprenyl-3-methyl-5-hydroxy-6-metoxy-1,4-benzoquinol methylase